MAKDANPRKQPRQERAKATVDAIMKAAAQVLIAEGYENATTARIAERAGVSIGSLYQYFPNKEALVAALIERHSDEIVATVDEALTATSHETLEDGMRALIHAAVTAHRLDPKLHKILHEQVPRVGRLAKALDTTRRVTNAIEVFLRQHEAELKNKRDPAMAALVVETALEALSHKAVIERHDLLRSGAFEGEMLSLVTSYLTGK
ncbi:TetR/AcrR family transcriptional regulator [Dongia sedimenti]|uniref:TetR/AcrR family transcriptional regulator n=1 Tax=Dongia sedimenti TaxID=3064282 RepID=A0ABU0YEQ4_9PROT|nr:TetR/AcrR family transcriptional regulator [Rhodospirillaceae bacterium R-7]